MLVVIVKFESSIKRNTFLNNQDESTYRAKSKVEQESGCKKTKQNVCVNPTYNTPTSPCNPSIHAIMQAALISNILLPTLGAYLVRNC